MNNIEKKYNLKSPAVKRLMREAAELSEPTQQYFTQPLDDNLFEWHFTVRGPPDTEYAGGRYHGRIILPPEYPMKPPNIILITSNGRFELGKKICLSMSAHHPETWQPSWSIRTVLLALIGFMPTKGGGAIGALDYTPEERKVLAERSKKWTCDICGAKSETCLVEGDASENDQCNQEAKALASQIDFKGETDKKLHNTLQADQSASTIKSNEDGSVFSSMDQKTFDSYMSQMCNLYNPSGMAAQAQGQYVAPQPWSSNLPENPNASKSEIVPTSPFVESSNNNSTSVLKDTSVRQRAIPASSENSEDRPNVSNVMNNNPPPRVQAGSHLTMDNFTVTLMWIITAILLVLILRRLAMEGSPVTKS